MRFLENLVGDLIGGATPIPSRQARRVIRRIGMKNLLLIGGAALAGGLAVESAQRQGATRPAPPPTGVPPPPPPPPEVPSAAPPPPPLPPLPESAPAAADQEPELPPALTYAVVRTMVAAALADGEMAPAERQAIHRRLEESGLDEDAIRQVHRDLVLPPTPDELARLAPTAEGRQALYRCAAVVVWADGALSDLERGWLDRLAAAFGLTAELGATLEGEVRPDA